MITFEDMQATKEFCPDIEKLRPDIFMGEEGVLDQGYIYLDSLQIRDNLKGFWTKRMHKTAGELDYYFGRYCLVLGNKDWYSDSLEVLETILFHEYEDNWEDRCTCNRCRACGTDNDDCEECEITGQPCNCYQ